MADMDRDRGSGRSSVQGRNPDMGLGPFAPESPGDAFVTASDPAALILQSLRAYAGKRPVWAPTKQQQDTFTWDTLTTVGPQETVYDMQVHQVTVFNWTAGWVHEIMTDTYIPPTSSYDIALAVATSLLRWEMRAPGTVTQGGSAGQIVQIRAFSRWLHGDI